MSAPSSSALPARQDPCPCKGCETARRQEAAKWQAAIQRVRDLHTRNKSDRYECADGCCYESARDECSNCQQYWPCDTIRILDGEQA